MKQMAQETVTCRAEGNLICSGSDIVNLVSQSSWFDSAFMVGTRSPHWNSRQLIKVHGD